ncbi:CYFA0S01e18228g1_1 [Cyberlindnera fabianii]|uniref:biotin synthase n=1 Tax=Cyberlindnera fabianii TaxID=36022 RepID=A0A061ASZ5_CYBFA|nr:Biotin synthase, mitochondrial [Cyberlindnera fabianii]CDR37844.1 CYFA0S01e18228g1_1 [Cyberlindnera fabianii]
MKVQVHSRRALHTSKAIFKPYTAYTFPQASIGAFGVPPMDPLATEETPKDALSRALSLKEPSTAWSREQIKEIHSTPLMNLMFAAQTQHRRFHDPTKVQLCTLMNIKTGGCTEDCKYCAQSNRYDTNVEAQRMVQVDEVIEAAREAKRNGSTRFCMGAAWRDMNGRKNGLKKVKEMVEAVHELGMESCVTLGMINSEQARELKSAGLTAYNHNIDTSREHYPKVITTRTYDDRLKTVSNVQSAGLKACTGGILGLGETSDDHVSFIHTLATMDTHPESLPINRLVPIKGTPMYEEVKNKKLSIDAIVRTIATARLVMPRSIIRLAAGRYTMKDHEQFLCFMAGCNAIFTGKKMLTTMCNGWDEDKAMLETWGLSPMESFSYKPNKEAVEINAEK